jgi:hypothetical protein
LSDNGALVIYFLPGNSGEARTYTVALTRPYEDQKLLFERGAVGYAGISADGRCVFVRGDPADGDSRLIEIEVSSGAKRVVFSAPNGQRYLYISGDGSRFLIRYLQAFRIGDRLGDA